MLNFYNFKILQQLIPFFMFFNAKNLCVSQNLLNTHELTRGNNWLNSSLFYFDFVLWGTTWSGFHEKFCLFLSCLCLHKTSTATPLVPQDELYIAQGALFVDPGRIDHFPAPLDFTGQFMDGSVLLSWNPDKKEKQAESQSQKQDENKPEKKKGIKRWK